MVCLSYEYHEIVTKLQEEDQRIWEQVEKDFISKGIIITREEEKEYSDNYYAELRNKYGDLFQGIK